MPNQTTVATPLHELRSCVPFHQIVANSEQGGYFGTKVYMLEGSQLLYRRVSRKGRSGLRHPPSSVLAGFTSGLIELQPWHDMNKVLGLSEPLTEEEQVRVEVMKEEQQALYKEVTNDVTNTNGSTT